MSRFAVPVVLAVVVAGFSCAENSPPKTEPQRTTILSPPVDPSKPKETAKKQSANKDQPKAEPAARNKAPLAPAAASGNTDNPVPPKGAQYTIFCARIEGDAHVERANKYKNELLAKSGMNGWYVIHGQDQSSLYYGFYRTFNDPNDAKEVARAQGDRKRLESLTDGMQNRLFPSALFVDVESPDPQAPREWDLTKASGYWTLQIAAYKDSPQRKDAAVEAVREARAQGIPAYFYHGETISSVCIGTWPEEAVQVTAAKSDPHSTVVAATADMPGDIVEPLKNRSGLQLMRDDVRIVDPTLKETMVKYPYHAVNGLQMVKRVNGQDVPDPSLLVKIPRTEEQTAAATAPPPPPQQSFERDPLRDDPTLTAAPAQQATQPPPPPNRKPPADAPGKGKLKSIGK